VASFRYFLHSRFSARIASDSTRKKTIALVNYSAREITAKVVYYGPGLCGKTTNLEHIHKKADPSARGRLLSLATQTDRTLFFDLLPIELREIRGVKIRLQIYTVPGQVFYNETRKLVLKNSDAVVMVLDSQKAMREKNIESMNNLFENLKELDLSLDSVPVVLQYNKRDLKDLMPVEEMDRLYNTRNWPRVEAAAIQGDGVLQTLKIVTKLLYDNIRRAHFREDKEGELRLREAARPASAGAPSPRPPAKGGVEPEAAAQPGIEGSPAPPETAAAPDAAAGGPPISSDSLLALDAMIKSNLAVFKDTLDLPFFDTARGLFNDLNSATGRLFDETTKMREDMTGLRKCLEDFSVTVRAVQESAQSPEKRSILGSLFQKK